jgi:RNB domain
MTRKQHTRSDLARIAAAVMRERGLEPEFPAAVLSQLASLSGPARGADPGVADMTALPWCSIDNDDSRDLDQLSCCEVLPSGAVKLMVAVADVDALVHKNSPIDRHAHHNTTSVYTGARIFPMLPERLSTDLSSLNPQQDRLALVTTMARARFPRPRRPLPAWTRSCAHRMRWRSNCARAAWRKAHWNSRPSSRVRCSTQNGWSTSWSSRTTGRAS